MNFMITGRLGLLITPYLILTNMTTAAMSFNSPVFTAIDAWFYVCKLIIIAAVFEFAAILKMHNSRISSDKVTEGSESVQDKKTAEIDKERVQHRKVDARAYICFNITFAIFCIIYMVVCLIMGSG